MRIKLRSKNKFIPVNVPKIFKDEKRFIKECLDTGWISSEGSFVNKFEKSFSKYNNRKFLKNDYIRFLKIQTKNYLF